jgi:elongation factor G-like protein
MTPRLLQPSRFVAMRRAPALLHPECPIEQSLWSPDEAVQAALLAEIWRQGAFLADGVLLVPDPKSLRVLARSEAALREPVQALKTRHGARVIIEPPTVRYAHGAPVLEPWMTVLASGPAGHLRHVQGELGRRGATITRVEAQRDPFVLEAEAPLAQLLGYGEWLEEQAVGVEASVWLSRYRPIGGDGPRAA